jgi:hypothetical protein
VTLAVTRNTNSGRVFRRYRVTVFQRHRLPLTGSRRDIRLVSFSGKTPTFCVFLCINRGGLWKGVVTLPVTGIVLIPIELFDLAG